MQLDHEGIVPVSVFPYLCFYCKESCVDRAAVKEHLLEQHPFEYWFIALSTKARNDRKRMKRYLCKSPTCNFYCHSLDDYDSHACVVAEHATLDTVTPPPAQTCSKIYQCSYCTCMMTSVHDIRAHVSTEHATSDGGYTEIQSGFGENGDVVMNVNSEVTSSSVGMTDVDLAESSSGSALVSPAEKTPTVPSETPVRVRTNVRIVSRVVKPNEISDETNDTPVTRRTIVRIVSDDVDEPNEVSDDLTEPNDTPVSPHTTVGNDSGEVDDVDASPNAVLNRKKQDGAEKVDNGEAATVPKVSKLKLKLGNNLKCGNAEDDVGGGYSADSESDVDTQDDAGTVTATVNGQAAVRSGDDDSDDSSNSGATNTASEIETPSTEKVVGPNDLSDQEDETATESDSDAASSRGSGSDEHSAKEAATSDDASAGGSGSDEHSGKEDASVAEVIADGDDTTVGSGGCNSAATDSAISEATENCNAGQRDEEGGDGKTNGDPESPRSESPHPPVTISIKIVPPKDGWKTKTDSGESSTSSNDDSLESDDDADSSDSNTRSSIDE